MAKGPSLKEIEEFPRRLKIFMYVIILLFVVGIAGFRLTSEDSIQNAFYRTIQTFAFIFSKGDSLSERLLEVFLATVGIILLWWVLWSVADLLLEGNLRKYLKKRFYSSKIMKMKNHVIIIGGGRVGEEISRVISTKKKSFLIVESNHDVVSSLKKKGYVVIEGDGTSEEILNKANIKDASKIIIYLPKTETNILITLTAKELNSKIEVHARCENPSLVSKLKRAGAKVVTVPEIIAADKIAKDLKL